MGWLRRIFGGGGSSEQARDGGLYLYVRCLRCGAPVRIRISVSNDVSAEYNDDGTTSYVVRKEMIDDRCFRLMTAMLLFDSRLHELRRAIEGGEFISAEEYARLKQPT